MANQSLTDLTARTATANTDLIHVNSDGTDYKETKANFLSDVNSSISSLNSSLTNSLNYFQSIGHNPEMVYDLNRAWSSSSNGYVSIVQYYAESTSSAHTPATGNGMCIIFRTSASYGVQFVICNVGIYVRYINSTFGGWKQIHYYTN